MADQQLRMFTFVELFQIVLSIDPALIPDDLLNLIVHFTTIEVSNHRAYLHMFYPGYIQDYIIHFKSYQWCLIPVNISSPLRAGKRM